MKDYTDSQLDELYAHALDAAADSQASKIDVEQALLTLQRRILNDNSVTDAEAARPAPNSPR